MGTKSTIEARMIYRPNPFEAIKHGQVIFRQAAREAMATVKDWSDEEKTQFCIDWVTHLKVTTERSSLMYAIENGIDTEGVTYPDEPQP